jgi:hypothetical protein
VIEDLDTREFPKLTLNFSIPGGLDQNTSLSASQVSVIENDQQIAVDSLTSEYVGVHFGLVINPERTLVLNYPNSFSNYDRMLTAMRQLGSDLTPSPGTSTASSSTRHSLRPARKLHRVEKRPRRLHENQRQMTGSLQSLEEAVRLLTSNPQARKPCWST